jgi:hypothetical protein
MNYTQENSAKNFLIHTIFNYAMAKNADFDSTRQVLDKFGVTDLINRYSSPWVSHNQKWRNKKIDSILDYKGVSLEKELQYIEPATQTLAAVSTGPSA